MKIFALVAAAVVLWFAAPAHADDGANAVVHDAALFCRWLDGDSSPLGVLRAVNEFEVQGVPHDVAVGTMVYALTYICPEHAAAARYAEAYYHGGIMGA